METQELVVCEVTRDSVSLGDDVDAPHTISFTLRADADLAELVGRIRASGFLPPVQDRVEWVLEGPEALARLDGEGRYVRFVGDRRSRIGEGPRKYRLRYNPAHAHVGLSQWHHLAIRLGIVGVPLKRTWGWTMWDRVIFALTGVALIAIGMDTTQTGSVRWSTDPTDVKISTYLSIIAGICAILLAILLPKSMSRNIEEEDDEASAS